MTYELRASDNRASGLATDQAIEGAARYVSYVLATYATNGVMPATNQYVCAAVPVGDARFWLIGRDPSGTPSSEPFFGLVDEGFQTEFEHRQHQCPFLSAQHDGRFCPGHRGLAEHERLRHLLPGLRATGLPGEDAPFETVDELRLVYGATMDLLAGDDLNGNGVLDANETNSSGAGEMNYGLFEYTTVYTREPNFHADGTTAHQREHRAPAGSANAFSKRRRGQRGLSGRTTGFSKTPSGDTARVAGFLRPVQDLRHEFG